MENIKNSEQQPNDIIIKRLAEKIDQLEEDKRNLNLILYNEYIDQQKDCFLELLNFINEYVVNSLNAEGGIITEPIRLEARIKSPDSALANDAKARGPYDPPSIDEEKSSDLSDIFGITFVYSGDDIDDKLRKKAERTGKPYPKPEKNEQIEQLILNKINSLFHIHLFSNPKKEVTYSGLDGFTRHYKSNTGYDSLHGTGHLRPESEELLFKEIDPEISELLKYYIPQVEFHITESRVHKKAALDFYHILKFAGFEDQSNFKRAQERNDIEKMNEIFEKVKLELQSKFDKKGYNFIPETSIPEMYVSTDSGEIKKLPKEGLNGSVKKLFYFLDISKREFKDRLTSPSPKAGITNHSSSPESIHHTNTKPLKSEDDGEYGNH